VNQKSNYPIFYDPHHRRWRWIKSTLKVVITFLITIFACFIVSMVISPELPNLNLVNVNHFWKLHHFLSGQNSSLKSRVQKLHSQSNFSKKAKSSVHTSAATDIIGFYVNWDDNSFTSLKQNIEYLDKLMPEWLHLRSEDGEIAVDNEVKQQKALTYIKQHRPNLPIIPLINNYDNDTQSWNTNKLVTVLQNPTARQHLIENLLNFVRQNNFAGINIDFENIPDYSQKNLVTFMQELYTQFHPLRLEVSQSVPLDNPSFNYKKLAQFNDYLILMAYDEHETTSQAGAVASQNWYVEHLQRRLTELAGNKYVIAIGNYGYDWQEKSNSTTEVSFQEALKIARESEGKIVFAADTLNPTFDYYDDQDRLHHVWFLDAITAFNEVVEGESFGVRGFGLWRLGSEDPSVWEVFKQRMHLGKKAAQSLSTIHYGFDIDYEGKGEVLKVTATPRDGQRDITYDYKSGLIVDEHLRSFPSPYVINRWGGDNHKKIALTFDDGPDPSYTPAILDILHRYNVPATFFIIGMNASRNPDLLQRMFQEGHEIGSHTFTHPNIAVIAHKQLKLELNATERLLEGELGIRTLLFRPPYAEDVEPETPEQVTPLKYTGSLGYYTIGMQIDPGDWQRPGVEKIVQETINQALKGDGNVVLLHDSGGDRSQTVAALPGIIQGLRDRGFELVAVSELLGLTREQVMPRLAANEKWMAKFDWVAFFLVNKLNQLIYYLFVIGIAFSTMRLLFIVTLAVWEWKPRRFCRYAVNYSPSVSVVVPAFNEEKVICKTINSILRSNYKHFDVIVVDDGSQDNTYQCLVENFACNSRVSIFRKTNAGKAQALNYGIKKSDAEIIVTLDADTLLHPNAIANLVRHFADPTIAAVAGNAKVGNRINILTRWQALEYITSQNLERRAFGLLNCISVVPGAIGAWRRELILLAGGYESDTLAEDADLTLRLLRLGYKITCEAEAIALTEAPDNIHGFLKQRFRWMFGTLQAAWKHRDTLFRSRYKALGMFALPNVFVFQILFPLVSPLMDLVMVWSIVWTVWQKHQQPVEYGDRALTELAFYYLVFLTIDFLAAVVAFALEGKEDWKLLVWLLPQRFFYRQLMCWVAIKSAIAASKGQLVSWGKLERKATVC
jgi:cellulose synthase/poly-beta-1,6-N-acetylglucosamine synthase-like glycosyltransferase/peptidoglycan/xylan/chitin deacetylase (PgdA/CDA1 family)/spore germination protein YaaH